MIDSSFLHLRLRFESPAVLIASNSVLGDPKSSRPQVVSHYRQIRKLGGGGYASVFLVQDLDIPVTLGNEFVAKKFDASKYHTTHLQFQREARYLFILGKHWPQYFPQLYGCFETDHAKYLILEYVQGVNLIGIHDYTERQALEFLHQMMPIMSILNRLGLTHRDITPDNIIREPDGNLRLIDLGMLRELPDDSVSAVTKAGTVGYSAPESLHGRPNLMSDLYGLGMVTRGLVRADQITHPMLHLSLAGMCVKDPAERRPFGYLCDTLGVDGLTFPAIPPLARQQVKSNPPDPTRPLRFDLAADALAMLPGEALESPERLVYSSGSSGLNNLYAPGLIGRGPAVPQQPVHRPVPSKTASTEGNGGSNAPASSAGTTTATTASAHASGSQHSEASGGYVELFAVRSSSELPSQEQEGQLDSKGLPLPTPSLPSLGVPMPDSKGGLPLPTPSLPSLGVPMPEDSPEIVNASEGINPMQAQPREAPSGERVQSSVSDAADSVTPFSTGPHQLDCHFTWDIAEECRKSTWAFHFDEDNFDQMATFGPALTFHGFLLAVVEDDWNAAINYFAKAKASNECDSVALDCWVYALWHQGRRSDAEYYKKCFEETRPHVNEECQKAYLTEIAYTQMGLQEKRATGNLRLALESNPESTHLLCLLGVYVYLADDNYSISVQYFEKALSLEPRASTHMWYGAIMERAVEANLNHPRPSKSVFVPPMNQFQRALELDPCNTAALRFYSSMLLQIFDKADEIAPLFQNAIKCAEQCSKDPCPLHYWFGEFLEKMKQVEQAKEQYEQCLRTRRNYKPASVALHRLEGATDLPRSDDPLRQYEYGLKLYVQSRFEEAAPFFQRTLELQAHPLSKGYLDAIMAARQSGDEPVDADQPLEMSTLSCHFNWGIIIDEMRDIDDCNRIVFPRFAPAVTFHGYRAAKEQRDWARAIECFRRATELDPEDNIARNCLVYALLHEGRRGDAEALHTNQRCLRAEMAERGYCFIQHAPSLKRALELDPGNPILHCLMGMFRRRDLSDLTMYFRRALELDPRNPGIHLWYGFALVKLGENFFGEGADELRKGLEIDPGCGPIVKIYGELISRNMTPPWTEIDDLYRRAIDHKPECPYLREKYADFLYHVDRTVEALPHLDISLRHDPRSFSAHLLYGECLYELDRLVEAETHYDAVLEMDAEHFVSLEAKALILYRDPQRNANALPYLRRLLEVQPNHPRAHHMIATITARTGGELGLPNASFLAQVKYS